MVFRGSCAVATVLQSKHAVSNNSSVSVKDLCIVLPVRNGMNLSGGDASAKWQCMLRLLYTKFLASVRFFVFAGLAPSSQRVGTCMLELLFE